MSTLLILDSHCTSGVGRTPGLSGRRRGRGNAETHRRSDHILQKRAGARVEDTFLEDF